MSVLELLKREVVFLDGGMGTLLQAEGLKAGEHPEHWNLSHPEVITAIHRDYFNAGSHVVNANTFGASTLKFSPEELDSIVGSAIANARAAAKSSCAAPPKVIHISD